MSMAPARPPVVPPPSSGKPEIKAADGLSAQYQRDRDFSEYLCEPLEPEDTVVQSMPDVSPAKWHLAHTTWFFETLVLREAEASYKPFREEYKYLFNSYYNSIGEQFPRANRGLISRPTYAEALAYRRYVDEHLGGLIARGELPPALEHALVVGLHHEQQHQELMVTDIKHVLSCNPLRPVYRKQPQTPSSEVAAVKWLEGAEGLHEIGHTGGGFAYDNEGPRHKVYLRAFALADRLVTNGEYLAFIEDGGYERPELWLSEGWATVNNDGWKHPLYWELCDRAWNVFTLGGLLPLNASEPVAHVSYFEADAYARWAGARLPLEAEWEVIAREQALQGNFVESGRYHPAPRQERSPQFYGDVWEWTASPYVAYPGYRPAAGALGEYNGKFMCNQWVLRGGSCATSETHIRATYRNFFPPQARWQFMGIRLARDLP